MAKLFLLTAIIAIALLVFLSGCTVPGSIVPVCGNNTVELGEQCDSNSSGCAESQVCLNNCSCGIPSPPALPE